MNKLYIAVLAFFLAGCASVNLVDSSGQDLMKSQNVVLKTNLHPDPVRHRLYTVNYQQAGLIPMCTEVELVELSGKRLVFKVKSTGVQYTLDRHRSTADLAVYLHDYFGTNCNKEKLNDLSDIDKEGIKKGKALRGMSKDAVILAIGLPPKHKTPSLESNQWRYWLNRWKTMVVEFDDSGKVSAIVL
ncbi:hypothetical protein [Aliikangiella sp. IMCC44359]|uniref:hypothetical protein n=1 Tax=Aliikangiella sp. IMCC44359 TaxID=3459125 RepID=UPI00403A9E37